MTHKHIFQISVETEYVNDLDFHEVAVFKSGSAMTTVDMYYVWAVYFADKDYVNFYFSQNGFRFFLHSVSGESMTNKEYRETILHVLYKTAARKFNRTFDFKNFSTALNNVYQEVYSMNHNEKSEFKLTHNGKTTTLVFATDMYYVVPDGCVSVKQNFHTGGELMLVNDALGKDYQEALKKIQEIKLLNTSNLGPVILTGGTMEPGHPSMLSHKLPGMLEKVDCPACNKQVYSTTDLRNQIIHLNDTHKWTRNQVADWLETLDIDLAFKVDNSEKEAVD